MTNCQSTVQLQGENSHQKILYLLVKIFQPCIYLSFQYVKYTVGLKMVVFSLLISSQIGLCGWELLIPLFSHFFYCYNKSFDLKLEYWSWMRVYANSVKAFAQLIQSSL